MRPQRKVSTHARARRQNEQRGADSQRPADAEARRPPTVTCGLGGWLWCLEFGGFFGLVFCRYC
jgi:hypothetical protein